MIITIDRFEGEFAVIELPNRKMVDVTKELFENSNEGDTFEIKKIQTERQKDIKKLMDEVWND